MVIITYLLGILSTVLGGIILAVIKDNTQLRKQRKEANLKEEKADNDLLLGIARIILLQEIEKALDRGHTTRKEYDVVEPMYSAYVNKGGNGTIKHLFEDKYEKLKVLE